jgi:phosphoglycolate phosphatase
VTRNLSGYAVFDLDGTLVDSLGDISQALNRVLRRHGKKPVSEPETRDLIGKGPKTLVERAWILAGNPLGGEEARKMTREYLEEYRKNPKGGTRPFPGVDEGLRRLVQRGWSLGLCTNKDGPAARALVKELGWERWIRAVVSGEEGFRKPDPRALHLAFRKLRAPRGRHLFIGDSEIDLETARGAGVEGVFLGHGYGEQGRASSDGSHYFENCVLLFSWMARYAPGISLRQKLSGI